ncbi:ATP-binding protein [Geomonas sp. RF6]|uniref:ATP-binding protein n=1 Tax=Geomonas sp. RF6 TaxID=2897342 RepID=UPI001E4B8205|nr:ATP-binding protein [Geomonas sp. RF6]UFS72196.1 ATP-binding protein [Geomonas sp. RF6]
MAPRHDEETYRTLFELSPQPMWVCEVETRKLVAVNEAALAMYGYTRREFLDLSVRQIVREGSTAQGWERHLRRDETLFLVRTERKELDFGGARAQLVLLLDSVQKVSEEPAEQIAELERQLSECRTRLEASNKELETFSYSVSHDLRAPLRHIDGFSKALLDDYGDKLDEEGKEYLGRICQATQKMGQLIDDVLKMARVTRAELDRQNVNLSVVAQVIALEMKHADPARQVEFHIEKGLTAHADPRLTRLLLENLLGNAWKFTGKREDALIEFGATEGEGETVYFVRDNGAGFDMAYAGKLFSLFQRLHRADEFEGSGVGLAVAHRIVRRHGGRIWGEGSPGSGATFYFTL